MSLYMCKALLQVNMERPCPYKSGDAQCGSKECGIGYCDDEVPEALRRPLVNTAYGFFISIFVRSYVSLA